MSYRDSGYTIAELGIEPDEYVDFRRNQPDEAELDRDREWFARRHFPNLSTSVAPRESDETPTFWED